MKLRKYTEEELRNAVKSSKSIRQALKRLGVADFGGNYATFHKAVVHFNLDISHFGESQGWSKGKKLGPKKKISEYLSNQVPIQSNKLRIKLLDAGIFDSKCSRCNLSIWMDNPIPLELDHINGDNQDNSISNLRMLCPNCHALTLTYRGRNKKKLSSALSSS